MEKRLGDIYVFENSIRKMQDYALVFYLNKSSSIKLFIGITISVKQNIVLTNKFYKIIKWAIFYCFEIFGKLVQNIQKFW